MALLRNRIGGGGGHWLPEILASIFDKECSAWMQRFSKHFTQNREDIISPLKLVLGPCRPQCPSPVNHKAKSAAVGATSRQARRIGEHEAVQKYTSFGGHPPRKRRGNIVGRWEGNMAISKIVLAGY